jgi:uncharacterized membrane protein
LSADLAVALVGIAAALFLALRRLRWRNLPAKQMLWMALVWVVIIMTMIFAFANFGADVPR